MSHPESSPLMRDEGRDILRREEGGGGRADLPVMLCL
jgi:hypothetical protein